MLKHSSTNKRGITGGKCSAVVGIFKMLTKYFYSDHKYTSNIDRFVANIIIIYFILNLRFSEMKNLTMFVTQVVFRLKDYWLSLISIYSNPDLDRPHTADTQHWDQQQCLHPHQCHHHHHQQHQILK